ncbi:MAG: NUDIX domain-containing protein, partial [Nakamurella sp.]
MLLGIVRLAAAEIQVVVAGAIIEDGRVLAARRTHPPELAGKWERPGGKVRPGESEAAALTRELAEELAVDVVVGDRI